MTENILKVSKRLLITLGIFGLCMILSVAGLIAGFYLAWQIPEFLYAFIVTFAVSSAMALTMGIMEMWTKNQTKKRLHEKEMLEIKLKYEKQ